MKDFTDHVKFTDETSKFSSSCLLLAGFTYIYVLELLIHEILKFVFIISPNIIFVNPLLLTEEMTP